MPKHNNFVARFLLYQIFLFRSAYMSLQVFIFLHTFTYFSAMWYKLQS